MKQLFATTARGFEELLKSELTELGAQDAKVAQGGVHYWADDETLYRTLLWSRLSSRILLPIVQAKVFSDLDLYSAVVGVNWLDYFDEKVHFFVDFNGTNQEIRHTQFGAMRVKDGIVDYFARHGRARPNVDKEQPDIRIHAYLNRDDVVLSLDLSGYPDCRDVFVKSMNVTLNLAMDYPFEIRTPLMWLDKKETWALADQLGAFDYIRRHTHTCYNGVEGGCGECPSCVLRERGLNAYLREREAKNT